jgi:hypothetical protein
MKGRALVFLCLAIRLEAQVRSAPTTPSAPIALSRAEEIRLARSAAPEEVSKAARIYILQDGRYVIAEPGTSSVACLVSRSQLLSLEPECGDAEAEATVLAVERFRVEQRIVGRSAGDIDRAVADSIAVGRFRLPRRPAMVYMMSSAQILYDDSGIRVGRWQPHIMVYYPFLLESELGLPVGSRDMKGPMMDKPGTPLSNITIVMRSFVDPAITP